MKSNLKVLATKTKKKLNKAKMKKKKKKKILPPPPSFIPPNVTFVWIISFFSTLTLKLWQRVHLFCCFEKVQTVSCRLRALQNVALWCRIKSINSIQFFQPFSGKLIFPTHSTQNKTQMTNHKYKLKGGRLGGQT